ILPCHSRQRGSEEMIVSWPCLMGDVVYQARPQPDDADQDQVDRDDVIEEARDQQDQDAGDQRNEGLDKDNIEAHQTGSAFAEATGTGRVGGERMDETLICGCLCGQIRYRITAAPVEALYCHCRMCQRAHGAPVIAWLTVPLDAFLVTAGDPAAY